MGTMTAPITSRPIKLGFIGAGYMGQIAHIANYARLDGVELVALAEGRPQLARKVADHYGIREVYADHRELLRNADVDAVIAIMGFNLHHAVVPDILNAGKHLLTEKAICIRPETGQAMADLATQKGLIYQIGYMKRCDAGSRYVKQKIAEWNESGAVGKLRYVRCTGAMNDWVWGMDDPLRTDETMPPYEGETPEPAPQWMNEEDSNRYISFVNFYIHQVNLLRYLINQEYCLRYVSPDGMLIVAESELGVPMTLEAGTNGIQNQWQERYTISFDKAEIELDLAAPLHRQMWGRVCVTEEGPTGPVHTAPFLGYGWAFQEQARLFIQSLRGEAPLLSPAASAVPDLRISEDYIRMTRQTKP